MDCVNDNGEAMLSWCAQNGLAVINTTFQKKIHQHTWQHPRRYGCDVSVLRSADCWTDHKLLGAKLKIGVAKKRVKAMTRKSFAVNSLQDAKVRDKFMEKVYDLAGNSWDTSANETEMWEVIRNSMVDAAETTLGQETRKQPDWFKEKGTQLKELIDRRNVLSQIWLRSGRSCDRQRYVIQKREVTKAVKKAKNDWLQEKASEVEVAMQSGHAHRSMWKSVRPEEG